ncbi:MAG: UDP-N-acetylglucosamine 2-epimerase (non-hydrolyzing) [Acidobacteria bacterium]|nr:MAG: UDP-N-acetylglucosamine 2-epimerase (non-hydrolyzing) [Acidobacteriota bacterium]
MKQRRKIMIVFGTRPEAIKLAPVIHELERRADAFQTVNISSGQHRHLVQPVITLFRLRIDHDFALQRHDQQPDDVSDRVIARLIPHLNHESPDLLLVQGDTSTAVGAAVAGSLMQIPVGHIEAGLRSGDDMRPFPEEIHRKRITKLASYHFAPAVNNRSNLLSEGVPDSRIFVTGNTIVDSLMKVLRGHTASLRIDRIIAETSMLKRIVLTMHRRENIPQLERTFLALRRFVNENKDVCLVFPVHPNPAVRQSAEILRGEARIRLIEALGYSDFIHLLLHAWAVVTDSGGIQEEAPTLGKTVLLFRAKTERPEALATGTVQLIGDSPDALRLALENLKVRGPLRGSLRSKTNPFGNGGSAQAIVDIVENLWEGTHESIESALFQRAQRADRIRADSV